MAKPLTRARSSPPPAPRRAPEETPSHRRQWIALLVAVIILAALGRVVGHDFVFYDDNDTIANNPNLNPPTIASVLQYWNPGHPAAGLYVPVTYTVWGLCAKLAYVDVPDEEGWNLNPYVFHAASLLVHLANVLLLFLLLARLTRHDWAAALGALLFGLHPVQMEALAWTSGLKDLLGGMFILLVLLEYLNYSQAAEAGNTKARLLHLALGGLAVILGMLSKPSAVVAPVMAGAIGYFILRQPIRRVMFPVLIWLVVAMPLLALATSVQPDIKSISGPLSMRPLVMSFTLSFYLFKLIWPARLAMDYGWYLQAVLAFKWLYLLAIVPIGFATALAVSWRRLPWLAGAMSMFLVGILPVLGLKGFHTEYFCTVSDHYLYPAMIGIGLGLACFLAQFGRPGRRNAAYAVAGTVVLALGVRSCFQLTHYATNVDYFEHIAEVTPGSFLQENYAGYLLKTAVQYRIGSRSPDADPQTAAARRGEADELMARARANLDTVIRVRPEFPMTYRIYSMVLIADHHFDQAEQMIQSYADHIRADYDIWGGQDLAQDHIEFAREYVNQYTDGNAVKSGDQTALKLAERHLQQALVAHTTNRAAIRAEIEGVRVDIRRAASGPTTP